MEEQISLTGLSKAKVLMALYDRAKPQGLGMLYTPDPMTEDEAKKLLEQTTYFDYVQGRVMKVELSGDSLDPVLYDRDNGIGAARSAIASLG